MKRKMLLMRFLQLTAFFWFTALHQDCGAQENEEVPEPEPPLSETVAPWTEKSLRVYNSSRPERVIYRRKLPLGIRTINKVADNRVYDPNDGKKSLASNEIPSVPPGQERRIIEEKLEREKLRPVASGLPAVITSVPRRGCVYRNQCGHHAYRVKKIYHNSCGKCCRTGSVIVSRRGSIIYSR